MTSPEIDARRLGQLLQDRLGLSLTAKREIVDGGLFTTLRPSDLEEGNGFSIIVSRTARQIEASFKADNFAGHLIRKMSQADASARGTFHALLAQARRDGDHIYLEVNGSSVEDVPKSNTPWTGFGLDVTCRLPGAKLSEAALMNVALKVASTCMIMALSLLAVEPASADELDKIQGLPEGARIRVEVNRYERSPVNRAACIQHYGATCQACGFDFKSFYGDLGEGYIQVHHRTPVSQMSESYFVNPVTDLVPVCANCHAMVHRHDPPMPVEALRDLVNSRRDATGT
jgi:5-methylcytosine-specific restriction protein A